MAAETKMLSVPQLLDLQRTVLQELLEQPTIRPRLKEEEIENYPIELKIAVGNVRYMEFLCSDHLVELTRRLGLAIPIMNVPLLKHFLFVVSRGEIKILPGQKRPVINRIFGNALFDYEGPIYEPIDEPITPFFLEHAWITGKSTVIIRPLCRLTPFGIRGKFIEAIAGYEHPMAGYYQQL